MYIYIYTWITPQSLRFLLKHISSGWERWSEETVSSLVFLWSSALVEPAQQWTQGSAVPCVTPPVASSGAGKLHRDLPSEPPAKQFASVYQSYDFLNSKKQLSKHVVFNRKIVLNTKSKSSLEQRSDILMTVHKTEREWSEVWHVKKHRACQCTFFN